MDQSEADWGDWSMNNDGGLFDLKQEPEEVADQQLASDQPTAIMGDSGDYKLYEDYEDGGQTGDSESEDEEEEDCSIVDGERSLAGPECQSLHPPQTREGMVMCEYCGKLGVRDAFYSKTKRFCSVTCSKSYSAAQKEGKPTPYQLLKATMPRTPSRFGAMGNNRSQNYIPSSAVVKYGGSKNFDWSSYLNRTNASASPVSSFRHCPMASSWDNITVGMKVEVHQTDCDLPNRVYWIATVRRIAGYKAQLRYEGFGSDPTLDFWTSLCSKDVYPVGWCAANGKPLVPPKSIQHKYLDWKDFLVKRLTGARTLPQTFFAKVQESLGSIAVKKGMKVEVVDKMCVSAMKVATVEEVIGGRLRLNYTDSQFENDEFWCHYHSPLLHPVGWCQQVGHNLHASAEYRSDSYNKAALKMSYSIDDATPDLFPKVKEPPLSIGLKFRVGMKLEAIDPLNLSSICVSTVMKVLRNNYLMIGMDGSLAQAGSDWFCYHAFSPCVFPVGFCEINNLDLTPPKGFKGEFNWFDYLKLTKSIAAPVKLFNKEVPKHGFKAGMKLEAVDLMEPRLICVGTISRVLGRLLRLHFDGWDTSYDQWVDCQSPDIYPVGWCETIGYHLEGPRPKEPIPQPMPVPKKRKSKSQIYRGPRKKRKPKTMMSQLTPQKGGPSSVSRLLNPQSSLDSSDLSQDSFMTDQTMSLPSTPHLSESQPPDFKAYLPDIKPYMPELSRHTQGLVAELSVDTNQAKLSMKPSVSSLAMQDMPSLSPTPSESSATPSRTVPSSFPSQVTPPMPVLCTDSNLASPAAANVQKGTVTIAMVTSTPSSVVMATNFPSGGSAKPGSLASSLTNIASMLSSPVGHQTIPLVTATTLSPSREAVKALKAAGSPVITTLAAPAFTTQKIAATQAPLYSIASVPHDQHHQVAPTFGIAHVVTQNIPRVIPGEPEKESGGPAMIGKGTAIAPQYWNVFDVCQFLRINDCGAHCDSFRKKMIDGGKFMALTKEQIVNLTGMKVGPSLKIYDLIQALKIRVAHQKQQQQQQQQHHQAQQQQTMVTLTPSVTLTSSPTQVVPSHTPTTTSLGSVQGHSMALKAQLTQKSSTSS